MSIEPLIRIDLGITEEPEPCSRHRKEGVQPDCDVCADTPPRQVPVPELAGFWVEIRNPRVLPYGEKRKLFTTTLPILPGDSIEDQLRKRELADERLERIVKQLITAWNLTPAGEDGGEVLPLPSQDPSAFDRAPDIVAAVIDGLARHQAKEPERVLPKAPSTS